MYLFKGEQIAINVDGSGRKPNLDDEMTYGRGFMDRITLSSSKSVKVCFHEFWDIFGTFLGHF